MFVIDLLLVVCLTSIHFLSIVPIRLFLCFFLQDQLLFFLLSYHWGGKVKALSLLPVACGSPCSLLASVNSWVGDTSGYFWMGLEVLAPPWASTTPCWGKEWEHQVATPHVDSTDTIKLTYLAWMVVKSHSSLLGLLWQYPSKEGPVSH